MTHILVFDSGVGGLSIVETIRLQHPLWTVDYAADAGFFPYGIKTDEELRLRIPSVCKVLVDRVKPDVLVIACNTASTLALDQVRELVSVAVVGTVPAIKPAAALTQSGVIGVLATPGTVRRQYLDRLEQDFAKNVHVIRHGSSGLVELAERFARGEDLDQQRFHDTIAPLFEYERGREIDVVVLACTHFPLVRAQISRACPSYVKHIIDTGEAIARQVGKLVTQNDGYVVKQEACAYLTGGQANRQAYLPALVKYGFDEINIIDV